MPARTLLAAFGAVVALSAPVAAMLPVDQAAATVRPRLDVAPRVVAVEPAPAPPRATASLGSRVSAALSAATARTVSAAVDVDGLGAVLRRDAGHALPPASTQKSYVATAALLAVGPDSRLRTEVAATGTATAGVLPGPLYLVAGGDPYLTRSGLQALAKAVRDSGVTSVQGLRLDDSRYDLLRRNPGWKSSWVPGELGPLSAFALDRNGYRTDRAYLEDPALPNAAVFRDLLRAAGVTVDGSVTRARRPAGATTIAERTSGPLSAVTSRLLKASDNFAAEMLVKEVGRVVRGEGSTKAGLSAVKAVLSEQGVPFGTSSDGSGLSSYDRQTTAGQVLLLTAVGRSTVATQLRAGLPVACVDGTLKKRMCSTAAARNVTAKTGTLSGVTALSGYATTRSGRAVRFSFQLTGVRDSTKARAAVDRACVLLASATD